MPRGGLVRPRFVIFTLLLGIAGITTLIATARPAVAVFTVSPASFFFVGLALLVTVLPVRGLRGVSRLDLTPLPLLTMALLYGTAAATVTAWASGAIASLASPTGKAKSDALRVVFNSSKRSLCVLAAGLLLWGRDPGSGLGELPGWHILARLLIAHAAYFSISTWLLSFGLWLRDGRNPFQVWRANFRWGALVSWSTPLGAYLLALFCLRGGFLLIGILIGVGLLGIYVARDHVRIYTSFLNLVDALRMARDGNLPHLKGETERVVDLATRLAQRMKLPRRAVELVERAAMLHNVGYISVDRDTVLKPAKLTESEMGEIRGHPESGMRILREVEGLDEVAQIVLNHHESPDGSGYPKGLRLEQIPLEASIVKVAEAYVAMRSERPHRARPLTHEEALEVIADESGRSFDATVAYYLFDLLGRSDLAERVSGGFGAPRRAELRRRLLPKQSRPVRFLPESPEERILMLKGAGLVAVTTILVVIFGRLRFAGATEGLDATVSIFFAALLGLAGLRAVRLSWGAYVSASTAIVLPMALLGGPIYAVLFGLGAIGWGLIHEPDKALGKHSRPNPVPKAASNGGIAGLIKAKARAHRLSPVTSYGLVLSVAGVASSVTHRLGMRLGSALMQIGLGGWSWDLLGFLFTVTTFYLIETGLMSALLSRDGMHLSPWRLWQRNYLKIFPEPLTYAVCGYAIYLGYGMLGLWATLPLFLFPTFWRHLALLRRVELVKIKDSLLRAIAKAIDEKDRYTGGHSASVVELSVAIAREMGMSERFVEELEEAAIRHDLGKVSWPNQVLRKPARLNEHEEETYKLTHPDVSAEIARRAGSSGSVCDMIKYHHERWDGEGYPHRLKGEEIPVGARILCVADSFDAMIHDRWYRRRRMLDDAIEELKRCSGSQFDPQVVGAFMRLTTKIDLEQLVGRVEAEVKITPPLEQLEEQPAERISEVTTQSRA